MASFPLPHPPNFRVSESSPGQVKLDWSDYPAEEKAGHKLVGFRLYRSGTRDELGVRLADEHVLGPGVFQFIDTTPGAGASQHYLLVAVEELGLGAAPFGQGPFGEPDPTGYDLAPFSRRPHGSPRRGWGEAAVGIDRFGI